MLESPGEKIQEGQRYQNIETEVYFTAIGTELCPQVQFLVLWRDVVLFRPCVC
jgi:hypothetical protein